MSSSKRILFAIGLCGLLFSVFWVDTLALHPLTMSLNLTIQEMLSPLQGSQALKLVNHLGGDPVFVVCVGVVLLDLARRKHWKLALYCSLTTLILVLMTYALKELTYSPRPIPFNLEHDSFPSGHTMRASLWCGLILLLSQLRIYKLPSLAQLVFLMIPLFVGFTRLALGRHWFDDVMGSYFLVTGGLLFLYWFCKRQVNISARERL